MCQKKRFMCVYRSLSFFLKTLVFFKDTKKYILGIKVHFMDRLSQREPHDFLESTLSLSILPCYCTILYLLIQTWPKN